MPKLEKTYLDGNLLSWSDTMLPGIANVPLTGFAYRAPDGTVVWIDPPDPGALEPTLLALGKPQHILVTFRDHDRAVDALAAKHGCETWVPKGTGGDIKRIDHAFDAGSTLPAGLRAVGIPACGYAEHALVAEAYGKRFAFIGDAVFNVETSGTPWLVRKLAFKHRGGPLSMKRTYRGGATNDAPGEIRKLLDEKLDALFLSHGEAVPENADRWLRVVLGEA